MKMRGKFIGKLSGKLGGLLILIAIAAQAIAHPLGIFSTNRYSRIAFDGNIVRITYVVDIAEVPAMHELEQLDSDHDGVVSPVESQLYSSALLDRLRTNVSVVLDGLPLEIQLLAPELTITPGQGGLKTLRVVGVFESGSISGGGQHHLDFADGNFLDNRGWKEIISVASGGAILHSSDVPQTDITNSLLQYPVDRIESPVEASSAHIVFTPGAAPVSASVEKSSGIVSRVQDGLANLISKKDLPPGVMFVSLFVAMLLGAGHALTPGHGKTVVAAYLVGSRGTAKHAAILGGTVTLTHTIGVFALGAIALFASKYVLPEKLFPWLGCISGLMVVVIGISLFRKRLAVAVGAGSAHAHSHDGHTHNHANADQGHSHAGHSHGAHSHGGHSHSHVPPEQITMKSLLMLGISGGLVPCPSAIVVLLSAVALGRIGFGLLLIVAFSVGLAAVLTGIGLLMVYAKGLFGKFSTDGLLIRWMPVVSSVVVTVAGSIIMWQAFAQTGIHLASLTPEGMPQLANGLGAWGILGLGFALGLKHALDTDHLIAVSAIVSERKGIWSSSIVGAMWGLGHTASLFVVGLIVIALGFTFPESISQGMELGVAAMLVLLGINVLRKLHKGGTLHVHVHPHGMHDHVHPHLHEEAEAIAHQPHSRGKHIHANGFLSNIRYAGAGRSVLVGMVHGLAGSAGLMLIVLATIPSRTLALGYMLVFGIGSIGGMIAMSMLIGLPFMISAETSTRFNYRLRLISGLVSIGFGLFYAWQIGVAQGFPR